MYKRQAKGTLSNVVEDTTPHLGGALDLNSNSITGTGNISITGGMALDSAGYANIELGGASGAYIDLKATNSDDYDGRIITTGTGLNIDSGSGGVTLSWQSGARISTTATGVDVTGTVTATTVDLGDWTITEASGVLKFAHSGTDKMKLDSSGNLTVVGDVTAFGSI